MKYKQRVGWLGCVSVIALVGMTGFAASIDSTPITEGHPASPEGMARTALPKTFSVDAVLESSAESEPAQSEHLHKM